MIKALARSGLKTASSATKQAVPSGCWPLALSVAEPSSKVQLDMARQALTAKTFNKLLGRTSGLKVSKSIAATTNVRYAHTDVPHPDFSDVKRADNPNTSAAHNEARKKGFDYALALAGFSVGACVAKNTVSSLLQTLSMSAASVAGGTIELDMNKISEGTSITVKWRGKPLMVRHRTDKEVEQEKAVAISELRDPQTDAERVQDEKWLVIVGICTHLGCVPIPYQGDYNGYYCPCHGSHYDASGRIRKGPAPLNMEVPDHKIVGDKLVVG